MVAYGGKRIPMRGIHFVKHLPALDDVAPGAANGLQPGDLGTHLKQLPFLSFFGLLPGREACAPALKPQARVDGAS